MLILHPAPAFEQNVSYHLWTMATLALLGVGLADGVEVGP